MAIIDKIYNSVDDFGLITSAEAKELGVTNTELVQQARRGKLVRVARGVYRMPIWPQQEEAPYAVAVKAAGAGARLCGESVVALLKLAPTNPAHLHIATPKRVRRNLGKGAYITSCAIDDPIAYYEGVPSQPINQAIKEATKTMGKSRALDATNEALKQGYLTKNEAKRLIGELSR